MIVADTSVCAKFGDDAAINKKLVRDWIANWLATTTPITALEKQRHIVMRHCFDADMVLDLHCDDMALNHIYIVPQNIPRYQGLSDRLGSVATLLAEDSGGGSFDEVWSGLWISLQEALPNHAWPEPVLSATLEYRGQADVYDDIAKQDATNLYDFFCDEDLIASAPSTPLAPACTPTALNACEIVRVTSSGLIAYHVSLGDVVKTGDVIADLISLDGTALQESAPLIYAGTDGIVFRCCNQNMSGQAPQLPKSQAQAPLPLEAPICSKIKAPLQSLLSSSLNQALSQMKPICDLPITAD